MSLTYINDFDIKTIHQRTQTTSSHTSSWHHCHYHHWCDVGFVLFHNVTCYIEPLSSHIHVNTLFLLKSTCTLVATSMMLGRVECIWMVCGWMWLPRTDTKKTMCVERDWTACLKKMITIRGSIASTFFPGGREVDFYDQFMSTRVFTLF